MVAAPCNEGLVVSADSLSTTENGMAVPSLPKLQMVAGKPDIVITVTGFGAWFPPTPAGKKAGEWMRESSPMFSVEASVRSEIEAMGDQFKELDQLDAIAKSVALKMQAFLETVGRIGMYTGKKICTLEVFRYEVSTKTSTRFRCVFAISPKPPVGVFESAVGKVTPDAAFNLWTAGEVEYANQHIFSIGSVGMSKLRTLLDGFNPFALKVSEITKERAALACEATISAAEHATKTVPAPSHIGGKPLTWFLNGTDMPTHVSPSK